MIDWKLYSKRYNTINTTYQGQNRQTASKCVQVRQVCVRGKCVSEASPGGEVSICQMSEHCPMSRPRAAST